MSNEQKKQQFDPYTGNPIEERPDLAYGENFSIQSEEQPVGEYGGDFPVQHEENKKEPTYDKYVWEPVREEMNRTDSEIQPGAGAQPNVESEIQPRQNADIPLQNNENEFTYRQVEQRESNSNEEDAPLRMPPAQTQQQWQSNSQAQNQYENAYGQNGYANQSAPQGNIDAEADVQKEASNGLSMACLVLGIISILTSVTCCFTVFSIPLAIASIVCGVLAGKPKKEKDKRRFMGLLLSIISIVVTVLIVVALFATIMLNGNFQQLEQEFNNGTDYDIQQDYDSGEQKIF